MEGNNTENKFKKNNENWEGNKKFTSRKKCQYLYFFMKCCRTKMFALKTQIPELYFPPKMVTQFFIFFHCFFFCLHIFL